MTDLAWQLGDGPQADIIVTTRLRLARNLELYPFPARHHLASLHEVATLLCDIIQHGQDDLRCLDMSRLHPIEAQLYVEQHLVSPAFASSPLPRGLALSRDGTVSVMINEEDHVRLQCLLSGLQFEEAWKRASQLEDFLADTFDLAYDEQFGFLTACPSNLGTGMRASAMVHLPALAWVQALDPITQQIARLGLTVRGVYGEGSQCAGHLLQISNQVTLGVDENDILAKIQSICQQVIEYELSAREQLMTRQRLALEDRVYRSYAICRSARLMESQELMEHLSMLRLGRQVGILPELSLATLNQLMVKTRPANLQFAAGNELAPAERDVKRAEITRQLLK